MVNFKNIATAATALFSLGLGAPLTEREEKVEILKAEEGKAVEGSYIVTLKPDVKADAFESHLEWVSDVHKRSLNKRESKGIERTYKGKYNFQGYAGTFDEETLLEIQKNPDVSLKCSWILFDIVTKPYIG